MLNRIKNMNESGDDGGGGGKLNEVSTKLAKMFRTAFRKENISQSRQQLQPNMEEEFSESDEKVKKNINRRRAIEKTQALDNSDWSSEIDFGSRTNLVNERKKSIEYISDSVKKMNRDENIKSLNSQKLRKLKRSKHVQSKEQEPEQESTSMNIVVDVHHENVDSKLLKNTEDSVVNNSSDRDDDPEEKISSVNDNQEKSLDTSLDNSVDSTKKQRKRWLKGTSVIFPPKRSSLSSANNSEKSGGNWMDDNTTPQSISTPKLKKKIDIKEKNNFTWDNVAFESDSDIGNQVLTIESEYGASEKTKIIMKSNKNNNDELFDKQNVATDHEKSSSPSDESDIKKITEIRESPLKNATTDQETESEIDVKRKPRSISSRKQSKSNFTSESPMSSTSSDLPRPLRVIDKFDKQEKIIKKTKVKQRRDSVSLNHDSGTSETSRSIPKSTKQIKKKNKEKVKRNKKNEIKYISITIHRADILVPDYITKHPMVIVHIVEEITGNYLKNTDENKADGIYLQPLITGMFDIKTNKSMMPFWDEELIFERDFNAVFNGEKNQALILFEIVDIPSVVDASLTHDQFGAHNCWYKIAWAFLRPTSSTGISHMDKAVRLQLYKPKRNLKKLKNHRCEPYSWWKSGSREKYPSTLFVTVKPIDPPKLEPILYSHLSLEEIPNDQRQPTNKSQNIITETRNLSRWSRLAAQSCKIPNEIFFKTEISENGCFYVVFSNNGEYIACVNCDEYDYPIVIYKIDEEKVHVKFTGHKNFVYALDWSNNDEILLSVSSDQTARLWDIKNKIIQEINMLPHPSYVYCGKFDPTNHHFIVTGCHDHVTRLWSRRKNSFNYELIQELDGQEGFINSICFLKNGDFLTADSLGVICQWTLKKKKVKSLRDWQISRKIKIREIKNIIINTIVLHPLGSRLLVHSRDNGLRILDLATGVVLQKYMGLKNSRIQITARISPCGGLLICGGEDATLNIWNLESCKHIAKYSIDFPNAAVTCVDYHPYHHVLVYSIIGVASETVVLRFNKQANGESVGLKLLTIDDHNLPSINNIEQLKSSIKSKQRFSRKIISNSDKSQNKKSEKMLELMETNSGSQENLRFKLKNFNDAGGQLKTRSANRLSSIIAKIDNILSNSSGSNHQFSYDIEANKNDENTSRHVPPYVPPLFSNFEDNSNSGTKSDTIEMTDMSGRNNKKFVMMNRKNNKSESARVYITSDERYGKEESRKIMSDSAMIVTNSHKKSRKSRDKSWNAQHYPKIPPIGHSAIANGRLSSDERNKLSSADSGDTYVLERSDDNSEIIESENSVRSNMTFVIPSENRASKARKKRVYEPETVIQIE